MNFAARSYEKELLDRDDLAFEDIRRNMQELEFINTHLGGHKITLDGMKKLLGGIRDQTARDWVICEVGCGGGDNLVAIHRWCMRSNIRARFIGIDINPYCIDVAKAKLDTADAELISSDYILVEFQNSKPDVIFSSLFCHHFTDSQLVDMLGWMRRNSAHGFFINDLHRNPVAYYSIKLLTSLFSSSYLVRNDAPLSVLRGFTRSDWQGLLNSAGILHHEITWKWAFRHLVIVKSPANQTSHQPA